MEKNWIQKNNSLIVALSDEEIVKVGTVDNLMLTTIFTFTFNLSSPSHFIGNLFTEYQDIKKKYSPYLCLNETIISFNDESNLNVEQICELYSKSDDFFVIFSDAIQKFQKNAFFNQSNLVKQFEEKKIDALLIKEEFSGNLVYFDNNFDNILKLKESIMQIAKFSN